MRRMRHRGGSRRTLLASAVLLATGFALVGCDGLAPPVDAGPSGSAVPNAGNGRAVSPLDNPDGTKPGLAAITSAADMAKARSLIGKVATNGRGPKTGYERDKFGYAWMDSAPGGIPFARNGCDSRNDLLKRDGEKVRFRAGSNCVVTSMTLHDPYTGKTIEWTKSRATKVQIDHVMPLSYDWQMGASRWTKGKREDIANDPLNLIPVDGPTNGAKSDSGPATWLPPDKSIRCSYSMRFAQVSLKYELPVTVADKQMMLRQCGG
ncbi:HNH endonuclease family protein [Streptomyces sp. IBSBF 2953]|uniref:HNH endonuclease family protein n=1 Tax=Streptomyces scabiei TaxID=1930 RepID=UPI00211A2187|nr:HNH endonuclease family protein [Streptomyces scabiei]MCQ9181490.1 HNH endonuclease family protein [Streptomyces hayashii]MDX3115993.1 HNH endonuclease family protein [Streptomyces scabiei]